MSAILLQNILMCLIVLGVIGFTIYFFYVRLYQKKEAKYPLVPPEGKVDMKTFAKCVRKNKGLIR